MAMWPLSQTFDVSQLLLTVWCHLAKLTNTLSHSHSGYFREILALCSSNTGYLQSYRILQHTASQTLVHSAFTLTSCVTRQWSYTQSFNLVIFTPSLHELVAQCASPSLQGTEDARPHWRAKHVPTPAQCCCEISPLKPFRHGHAFDALHSANCECVK